MTRRESLLRERFPLRECASEGLLAARDPCSPASWHAYTHLRTLTRAHTLSDVAQPLLRASPAASRRSPYESVLGSTMRACARVCVHGGSSLGCVCGSCFCVATHDGWLLAGGLPRRPGPRRYRRPPRGPTHPPRTPAPADDGDWAARAHAEARAALRADYWGLVSLAAARFRPSSQDPVDMLLVM